MRYSQTLRMHDLIVVMLWFRLLATNAFTLHRSNLLSHIRQYDNHSNIGTVPWEKEIVKRLQSEIVRYLVFIILSIRMLGQRIVNTVPTPLNGALDQ